MPDGASSSSGRPPGRRDRLRRAVEHLGAWPERLGLAAVAVACVASYVVWPVGPTYDLAFQLLWGADLAAGRLPELDSFRAPTQHPLTLVFGVLVAPLGFSAGGALGVLLCLASFVVLVGATFVVARVAFGRLVAWLCALLLVSRLDYPALAIRSYLDVPYLALVMAALALEMRSPRRGGPVWVLLVLGGLLRPEGWLVAGLYGLWMLGGRPGWWRPSRAWLAPAAWVAAGPAIWFLTDLLLTGNPLFSLLYTSGAAAEMQRQGGLAALPWMTVRYLVLTLKWPVALAAVVGVALALWRQPHVSRLPLALTAAGIVTFGAIVGAGLAAIPRYLAVSGLGLQLFAAFALGGWAVEPRGRVRTAWAGTAVVLLVAGAAFAATHTSVGYVRQDMRARLAVTDRLPRLLAHPAVRAGRRCGPILLPNQKLLADVRLALGGAGSEVAFARGDPRARGVRRGVMITLEHRSLRYHPAYTPVGQGRDSPRWRFAPPGYRRVYDDGWFAAHVRC